MFVSLDGYVETKERSLDWSFPDDQLHRFVNEQSRATRAFLYGRRLYELMAEHWPTVEETPETPPVEADFARVWRDTPKYVFSTILERAEWAERVIGENPAGEVARLKDTTDGEMEVGGPTLAAHLVRHGLVDEYRLFVFPVVLGGGAPFFPELERPIGLDLVETRTFDSGVVYLRYRV